MIFYFRINCMVSSRYCQSSSMLVMVQLKWLAIFKSQRQISWLFNLEILGLNRPSFGYLTWAEQSTNRTYKEPWQFHLEPTSSLKSTMKDQLYMLPNIIHNIMCQLSFAWNQTEFIVTDVFCKEYLAISCHPLGKIAQWVEPLTFTTWCTLYYTIEVSFANY